MADADQAQLVQHLDALVQVPTLYFTKALRSMPELQYFSAYELAQRLVEFGPVDSDNLEAWVALVRRHTHLEDAKGRLGSLQKQPVGFPLLRRMVTAQLVKAWATALARSVPADKEDLLVTLFAEVRSNPWREGAMRSRIGSPFVGLLGDACSASMRRGNVPYA